LALASGCTTVRSDRIDHDIVRFVHGADRNGDGRLAFQEFEAAVPPGVQVSANCQKQAFDSYDANHDGFISIADMRKSREHAEKGHSAQLYC
jgi:Ca2+-binding EF-hand superfamily protein